MKLKFVGKATTLMIILGWLLIFWGITNALADYRRANSPFDDPGPEQDLSVDEQGFLPYMEPAASDNVEHAPEIVSPSDSLAQNTQGNLNSKKFIIDSDLAQVSDLYRPTAADETEITQTLVITQPQIPRRLIIEKIDLNAPIIPVEVKQIEYLGDDYQQWVAPNMFAVGWHNTSAPLGVVGNTVLNGHHNAYGEVFRHLVDLENGDEIQVLSDNMRITYVVATKVIFKERFQSVETRMENARWIQTSDDERLTLITCWPYESNTHRVVVVAIPVEKEILGITSAQH